MHIMSSMAQTKVDCGCRAADCNLQQFYSGGMDMNEKIYKTMSGSGACSLVLGIVILVTGISAGVMMIVNGARLLKRKSEILL